MNEILQKLCSFCVDAGLKLIYAVLILVIGLKLIKFLSKVIKKSNGFNKLETGAQTFLESFINISLKVVLIITVAAVLGVPMTSMIAVLGSAGLAIGLALQGSLSNLAGGLMLLIFKPFKIGDYIQCGSDAGTVRSISILYTELLTTDNCKIVIPNGSISNAVVKDFSSESTRRVDFEVSVSYNSDIDKVKSLLLGLASSNELVFKTPAPVCYLKTHGDSALIFTFRCWTKSEDYWAVFFQMNENIKKLFDATGIEIPFPQLDVHLDK